MYLVKNGNKVHFVMWRESVTSRHAWKSSFICLQVYARKICQRTKKKRTCPIPSSSFDRYSQEMFKSVEDVACEACVLKVFRQSISSADQKQALWNFFRRSISSADHGLEETEYERSEWERARAKQTERVVVPRYSVYRGQLRKASLARLPWQKWRLLRRLWKM